MADFDETLFHEFTAECREHLEQLEPDLLALEVSGADVPAEIVNRMFRAVHSIKGAAGFLGFSAIQGLGHSVENVLMRIRDGELSPRPDVVDALLAGLDRLAGMVRDVYGQGQTPCGELVAGLDALLVAGAAAPRPAAAEGAAAVVAVAPTELTVRGPSGLAVGAFAVAPAALAAEVKPVYALWVRQAEDLAGRGRSLEQFVQDLAPFGECLASDAWGGTGAPADAVFHFLVKTVLDPDMVAIALDLPPELIRRVTPADLAQAPPAERPLGATPSPERAEDERGEVPRPPATAGGGAAQPETVRVSVDLLDRLMDLAGELVLGRNQLRRELEPFADQSPRLSQLMQHVGHVTSGLQEHIMRLRMQPVGSVLTKFPRVVRDLSRQLAKEVELSVEGTEVELDRSIVEGLSDPLTHLVRNCVDHGIEPPAEREECGKPRAGRLRLRAFHEGGQVVLTVGDDGAGIDADRVVEKAVARGFVTAAAAEKLSEQERLNLILLPGLSTARTVSDVSGRGVGMDVVKTNVERLGGHLELESGLGRGTTVRLRLPLTLAIIPSLVVGAAGQRFAVPQVNVKELVSVRTDDPARRVEWVGDAQVLGLRGRLLPLVRLDHVLQMERSASASTGVAAGPGGAEAGEHRSGDERSGGAAKGPVQAPGDMHVVVLRSGVNRFGLVVDDLFDNEEIVVKPLSPHLQECRCFSGATILGDGRVAMILDAAGLAETANLRFVEVVAEEQAEEARAAGVGQALLVFRNAADEQFALPLSSIARLEQVPSHEIQRAGDREFVVRRGAVVPLLRLETFLPVGPPAPDVDEVFLIAPKSRQPAAALVASKICDAVQVEAPVSRDPSAPRAFRGTAVIDDRVTILLDPDEVRLAAEVGVGPEAGA